jgi:Spy/CpxP family protein refolding chaperone
MKAEALALGRQIVEAEKRLDALFAERTASTASVSQLTRQISELQGQLRAAHLRAHVLVRAQLTPEQIAEYVTLRGYAGGGHAAHASH